MGVKTVFRVLIGTIVAIVMTSVIVEFFNVNINSGQLAQNMKMAARQSCILFTQETYKQDDINNGNGATNLSDIYDASGNLYTTGKFYTGTNAREIWENIYNTAEFRNFCNGSTGYINSSNMISVYPDLSAMLLAVDPSFSGVGDPYSLSEDEYNKQAKAETYQYDLYTTVNIGIPYMDRDVANKMFRWNLTQLLSNCNSALIQRDQAGQSFVNYKGFRVYCNQAEITRYTYEVLDMRDAADVQKLKDRTNIDGSRLGLTSGNGSDQSNNYVTIVGIEYNVPVAYEGITPIRSVFNYAWNHEVEGYIKPDGSGGYTNVASLHWNDASQNFNGGGLESTSGTILTEGKLIYSLIR